MREAAATGVASACSQDATAMAGPLLAPSTPTEKATPVHEAK